MQMTNGTEVVTIPCAEWMDTELGLLRLWPTVEFMVKRGFVEVVEPPHIPTPEEIEANKKALIRAISQAAKDYVELEANAALQDELKELAKAEPPHEMVTAIRTWGKAVYAEAELRKAQVDAGVADDRVTLCDFSAFGSKPYTVYQLYMAGLIQL